MLNSLILLVCFIRGSPPLGEVVLIKMAADGTPLGDKEKRQHGRLSKLQNSPWYLWYPKRVFPIYLVNIYIGMLATDLCSVVGGPQQGPVEQRL